MEPNPSQAILIAGPTAGGKSALALEIATRIGGIVVNADSMQVYDCWRLISARPSPAEMEGVPHCLYGHVSPDRRYSVGDWLREIEPILKDAARKNATPVIVGGTGLFFSALTKGLSPIPTIPADIREEADARMRHLGAEGFRAELIARDPAAATLDIGNPRRALRAWEVHAATGRSLSDWAVETPAPLLSPATCQTRLVLSPPRDALAERIDTRFEWMMAEGALDEVRHNLALDPDLPASKAIGAPQLRRHLSDGWPLSDAVEAAKAATRQYAKRQRTWFRNQLGDWPQFETPEAACDAIFRTRLKPATRA